MAFRKYTQCYAHTPGDKPFSKTDLLAYSIGSSVPGIIAGILAGLVAGPLAGLAIGTFIAYVNTITSVADQWLYHRLVCVPGPERVKCALGVVTSDQEIAGLGEFDNDEYFNVRLMPHRPGDDYTGGSASVPSDKGTLAGSANDIYNDGFQGQELLRPQIPDLPYQLDRSALHCEAEGDFWVRMRALAVAMGIVVAALVTGTAAAAAAGFAAGCVALSFLGPLGCLIGGLLGLAIAAGISYLIGKSILDVIFSANPGDVSGTNVGDNPHQPIKTGDKVVVYGEHVYDGFHEGWHEFHPLMAVMRINEVVPGQYLEWDPGFLGTPPSGLTTEDMRAGLESEPFRLRAETLRNLWCDMLGDAFAKATGTAQRRPENRWTIHPAVDGCQPRTPSNEQVPPKPPEKPAATGVPRPAIATVESPVSILFTQSTLHTTVKITGLHFAPGATVSFSGSGIQVDAIPVSTVAEIVVTLTIHQAGAGVHDVTVTNPDGLSSEPCVACFAVGIAPV